MILTNCAACAAPLAHTAPRCVRCWTRYCDSTCQHDHWRRGHKQICKRIHRGGNAEQYHADKKYKEAVAVAVEACADDTKGQTCYICTQALHWKTKEGLVRMCACRGTAGFAHVSCLAEQAKILVAEGEENNLGGKAWGLRFKRWYTCGLCEQQHHGVLKCALGWASWKAYLGRPEADLSYGAALTQLGNGLYEINAFVDALRVFEADMAAQRRNGAIEVRLLLVKSNIANCYAHLGRKAECLEIRREVYASYKARCGAHQDATLVAANNLANTLVDTLDSGFIKEAKSLMREIIDAHSPRERDTKFFVMSLRERFAYAELVEGNLREALAIYEQLDRLARRTFGASHPFAKKVQDYLGVIRKRLSALED